MVDEVQSQNVRISEETLQDDHTNDNTIKPIYNEKPRPWARFFARVFDIMIYSIFFGIFMLLAAQLIPSLEVLISGSAFLCLSQVIMVCTWVIPETFFLATYGTTPAKWAFNIRVRTSSGNKLTFSQGLGRSIGVMTRGMALGIPFVYLITMFMSYDTLVKKGKASWDHDGGYTVSHGNIGIFRLLVILGLFGLYLLTRVLMVV